MSGSLFSEQYSSALFSKIPRYCGTVSHQVNTPTLHADPDSQNTLEWFFKNVISYVLARCRCFFDRLSLNLIEPFTNYPNFIRYGNFFLEKEVVNSKIYFGFLKHKRVG